MRIWIIASADCPTDADYDKFVARARSLGMGLGHGNTLVGGTGAAQDFCDCVEMTDLPAADCTAIEEMANAE